ncbi:MAG: alpha/beta hydrolase [Agitococcus sp.]|nr:alpha/beta hydrolase [Agitococcus sp.]
MSLKEAIAKKVVKASLRVAFKLPSGLPIPVAVARTGMEFGAKLFQPDGRVSIKKATLAGVPCEYLYTHADAQKVVLHFHGGAFFAGSAATHRAMASELSARSGASVYMLDYRLAPEHPYPAALDDGLATYQALLALGYLPENIILGGDSGGCAHILNLAIRLRENGVALPAGLFMISPFVDLTLSAPSVSKYKSRDPMVTAYALQRGADGFRGAIAADDACVSPLFADLTGLPKILVQVGGEEILLDDALRLAEYGKAAGVDMDCQVYEGMWHNFQMFNQVLDTSSQALDEIAGFIKD